MNPNRAILITGTNLSDRLHNLDVARKHLQGVGTLVQLSSIYETAPWGKTDQDNFLNQVIELSTQLSAHQLLHKLLEIEGLMGRTRIGKWQPRLIDIDILYFNDEIISDERLKIPHPHLHERRFTLLPLMEILPDHLHPALHKTTTTLLAEVPDSSEVKRLTIQTT